VLKEAACEGSAQRSAAFEAAEQISESISALERQIEAAQGSSKADEEALGQLLAVMGLLRQVGAAKLVNSARATHIRCTSAGRFERLILGNSPYGQQNEFLEATPLTLDGIKKSRRGYMSAAFEELAHNCLGSEMRPTALTGEQLCSHEVCSSIAAWFAACYISGS
jgi:hypothetical protein